MLTTSNNEKFIKTEDVPRLEGPDDPDLNSNISSKPEDTEP